MKNNLTLKISVLIIAIFLWIQQTLLKTHSEAIEIPIDINNIPENLILDKENSRLEIPVTIEATGLNILFLKLSDTYFKIDASNFHYGKNPLQISKDKLVYPERMKIGTKISNTGQNLWITLDRLVTQKKEIQLIYESPDDKEFFLQNRIVNEEQTVQLKGPMSIVRQINKIPTEKINAKMVENGKLEVKLINPYPEEIELEETSIDFNITQLKTTTKTISLIPIQFPSNMNITIIPQKVTVMVRGPENILNNLTSKSIKAKLEIAKPKKGFYNIKFSEPAGVNIVDYTPQKVQVMINE